LHNLRVIFPPFLLPFYLVRRFPACILIQRPINCTRTQIDRRHRAGIGSVSRIVKNSILSSQQMNRICRGSCRLVISQSWHLPQPHAWQLQSAKLMHRWEESRLPWTLHGHSKSIPSGKPFGYATHLDQFAMRHQTKLAELYLAELTHAAILA